VGQVWPLAVLEIEDGQFDTAALLYATTVAMSEEIGSPVFLYRSLDNLGEARLLQGETEEATKHCQAALMGFCRLGYRSSATMAFFKLACCATRLGDFYQAGRLAGAYDVMHVTYTADGARPEGSYRFTKWTSFHQRMWDDNLTRLRESLGVAEYGLAYLEGAQLSFDEAMELALGGAR
jgi:hypothetical protein